MDAYEKRKYAEELPNMCDAQAFCSTCPLMVKAKEKGLSCVQLEERFPDEANKVVERWYLDRDNPED